jgi:hypothetical protein
MGGSQGAQALAELRRRAATDHQKFVGWARASFKATAYIVLIFFDIVAFVAIYDNLYQITAAHWMLLTSLVCANGIMFPGVFRVCFVGVGIVIVSPPVPLSSTSLRKRCRPRFGCFTQQP